MCTRTDHLGVAVALLSHRLLEGALPPLGDTADRGSDSQLDGCLGGEKEADRHDRGQERTEDDGAVQPGELTVGRQDVAATAYTRMVESTTIGTSQRSCSGMPAQPATWIKPTKERVKLATANTPTNPIENSVTM